MVGQSNIFRIGVDVGGTKIAIGIADAKNTLLSWVSIPTQGFLGRESVIHRILQQIEIMLSRHHVLPEQLGGVGIGFPGERDPVTKLILNVVFCPDFVGTDPGQLLHDEMATRFGVDIPVWADNDVCVAVLAEAKLGSGRNFSSLHYFTVSTDIGSAIFEENKLTNTELGCYIFPDPTQPDVPWLQLSGGIPAARLAQQKIQSFIQENGEDQLSQLTKLFDLVAVQGETIDDKIENLTAKIINEAGMQGDHFAREIFAQNALQLARGLAIMLSQGFGRERIILGGSVATKVPRYLDRVKDELKILQKNEITNQHLQNFDIDRGIVLAELGDERGILGAILLIQHEY